MVDPNFALSLPSFEKSGWEGAGRVGEVARSPISLTKAPKVLAGGETIIIVAGARPVTRKPWGWVPGR